MLALHPRLVAADDADADPGRACYFVAVVCVSLMLFVVLAASVSVARAGAITGAVLLLLGLCGWLAPGRAPAAAAPASGTRVVVHHRCACGLSDAAIDALPAFAYEPSTSATKGGDGVPCAVCLEDVRAGEMVRQLLPSCGHLFHAACVDAWLRAHRTCPLCRSEISMRTNVTAKASNDDVLPPV